MDLELTENRHGCQYYKLDNVFETSNEEYGIFADINILITDDIGTDDDWERFEHLNSVSQGSFTHH